MSKIRRRTFVWALVIIAACGVASFYRHNLATKLYIFAAHHPALEKVSHVAKNITPDATIFLLALGGLSYLMPELAARIEKSRPLRISLAIIFLAFVILTIFFNEIDREAQEAKQATYEQTLASLATENGEILKDVVANKDTPEMERRKHILGLLRNKYVTTHSDIPAAIVAGTDYPPTEWMNSQLKALGEPWISCLLLRSRGPRLKRLLASR